MEETKVGLKGFRDSNNYEQSRPEYPPEAVQILMNKMGLLGKDRDTTKQLTILELGAGTGKFTKVMASVLSGANVRIIASDPVKEMCEKFREVLPQIEIKQFDAENIDMPDESVHAVIAASCFHWFEFEESINEIHRSLAPDGKFAVIWYFPSSQSPWMKPVCDYLEPIYERNSITWPLLHHKKIIDEISLSEKFTKGDTLLDFLTETKILVEKMYNHFSSYSVVSASSDYERMKFKQIFDETIEKHLSQTGQKQLTVIHKVTGSYFVKRIN